jgi:starch synthase (maltosyl-transferring)
VLVVVNLDPMNPHDDVIGLDLPALGFGWDDTYQAHDELTGATYTWTGANPYVRLDPDLPAHILHLRPGW